MPPKMSPSAAASSTSSDPSGSVPPPPPPPPESSGSAAPPEPAAPAPPPEPAAVNSPTLYSCVHCPEKPPRFTVWGLTSHSSFHHPTFTFPCTACGNCFETANNLLQHSSEFHSIKQLHKKVGRHHKGRRPAPR